MPLAAMRRNRNGSPGPWCRTCYRWRMRRHDRARYRRDGEFRERRRRIAREWYRRHAAAEAQKKRERRALRRAA
jgi:hypothetical protein